MDEETAFELNTVVTEELYEELVDAAGGEKIAGVVLWEESLGYAPDEAVPEPAQRLLVDLDLYLENRVALELYGVAAYHDIEGDPLQGLDRIERELAGLVEGGLWLDEIAVDKDDELVLILTRHRQPLLYLSVGGWVVAEWDELPEQ